jgi:hypothetical protein
MMIQNRPNKVLAHCILVSLMAVTTLELQAQKFSLGLKAGPLIGWAAFGDKNDKDKFDTKPKLGFYGAGIIRFPLTKEYFCIIEGGYSQKGRRILFEGGGTENNANYQFVDAALLLRRSFHVNLGKNVPGDWYVNVGPHISYWLGGKGKIGTTGDPSFEYTVVFDKEYTAAIDNKMYLNDVNRYLFGVDIGVGMHAPIKRSQRVGAELRFTWGHTFYGDKESSANYNYINFEDNLQANERILTFTLSYMFDFDILESKKGRSTKDKEVNRKPVKRKKN